MSKNKIIKPRFNLKIMSLSSKRNVTRDINVLATYFSIKKKQQKQKTKKKQKKKTKNKKKQKQKQKKKKNKKKKR